jgi:hypothetical protein
MNLIYHIVIVTTVFIVIIVIFNNEPANVESQKQSNPFLHIVPTAAYHKPNQNAKPAPVYHVPAQHSEPVTVYQKPAPEYHESPHAEDQGGSGGRGD